MWKLLTSLPRTWQENKRLKLIVRGPHWGVCGAVGSVPGSLLCTTVMGDNLYAGDCYYIHLKSLSVLMEVCQNSPELLPKGLLLFNHSPPHLQARQRQDVCPQCSAIFLTGTCLVVVNVREQSRWLPRALSGWRCSVLASRMLWTLGFWSPSEKG